MPPQQIDAREARDGVEDQEDDDMKTQPKRAPLEKQKGRGHVAEQSGRLASKI
jgi:hypothetical protein